MIVIRTFGYRWRNASDDADVVVDCRGLRNPYRDKKLRKWNGVHPAVKSEIMKTPGFEKFYWYNLDRVRAAVAERQPLMVEVGCFGGKHRSVAIGEMFARDLSGFGYEVDLSHTSPAMEGW